MSTLKILDGTILTEERLIALQEENNKKLLAAIEVLIKNNTVPVPEPEPELPKCKRGPTIMKITKNSVQRIQVLFDADDVTQIYASFKKPDGTNILKDVLSSKTGRSLAVTGKPIGTFAPDTNDPILALSESVVAGITYKAKFKATLCSGESEKTFFFDVAPPPDPEKPCRPLGKITVIELTNR